MSLHGEGQGREIVVTFVRGKIDVGNQIDVNFRADEGGGMCWPGRLEEDAKDGSHEVTHMKEALNDGLELEVGARIAKPEASDEIGSHASRR